MLNVSSCRDPLPGNVRMAASAPVNDSGWLYLPGTPWSMRLGCGSGDRPALEVYAAASLIDVTVASSRASQLLRGACAAAVRGAGSRHRLGCLPTARGDLPSVKFLRGRIRRRAQPGETGSIADWFWFAYAGGRFSQVVVTSQRGRESCRIRVADAC